MSELKLTQIRGVGKVVSEKLIDHFRSEINAIKAIKAKDLSEIAKIDGVGQNGAIRIIRAAHAFLNGENSESFFSTPDIQSIYDSLLKILQDFCWTSYAKTKCYIDLLPLPKTQFNKLIERQSLFQNYYRFYQSNIPQSESFQSIFQKHFKDLQPLKTKFSKLDISNRIICTTLPEVKTVLSNYKLDQFFKIEVITSLEDLQLFIEEGSLTILITEEESFSSEPNNFVIADENSLKNPWKEFIPEKILNFFAVNKSSILALISLLELLQKETTNIDALWRILPDFDYPNFTQKSQLLKESLNRLESDGSINEQQDKELERLTDILNKTNAVVDEHIERLNDQLRKAIESENIKLSGKKFLELLQSNGPEGIFLENLGDYIDNSIFDLVEKLAITTEQNIISTLKLYPEEIEFVEEKLVSRSLTFPVQANSDLLSDFLNQIRLKHKVHSFIVKQQLASKLETQREYIEQMMLGVMELDFICMIGRVTEYFHLIWPNLSNNKTGLSFRNARNIFLEEEFSTKQRQVEPVSYEFGNIATKYSEPIAIISGANSGGKTTLLTLIAQISLLSQMGLGVPADTAQIGVISEIYYYRKPAGNMDAGAFESTLKLLSKMLINNDAKLVLADEMEAISEPEASAKVIGAILELLLTQSASNGIFVSHLAEQIRKEVVGNIRVDGIEATGLGEDLQLIVNRTPKIHYHARSTPQLIVERLLRSTKSNSQEKMVYQTIKQRFDND